MVLVTGGTGLVGAHLLLQLSAELTSVRAICREHSSLGAVRHIFSYYHSESEADILFAKIEWVQANINDIPAMEQAFRGVTHVYHCAALISFHPGDFQMLRKVNSEGTANIVNLCISHRVAKLCYVSSIATIGRNADNSPAVEEDFGPDRYPNVYALSKQAAELEVWRGTQEGVPAVIVNPGIILGPGFWKSASGSVFGTGDRGLPFAPPGSAALVSVKDVVEIMVGLMKSAITNERYIVVAENWPYKKLLQYIGKALNRRKPRFVLPIWSLRVLRVADWLHCLLTGGKRKLTRSSVESLEHPVIYNNQKVSDTLNYNFEPVAQTIANCCHIYKQEHR
jgi:nucleoside-diphosphate-sugar epimerase